MNDGTVYSGPQTVDWDDVRHFLALARTGSVRAAGVALGVSHSTVARRIEALELRLGAKLFDRHRDGYLLTPAGREMVVGAERVELEMAALERGLAGQDTRLVGPVRVTCTDAFLAKHLLCALSRLCERHPGIELMLDTETRNRDLSKREADIGVRALLAELSPPEHLIGRRLAPVTLCNYVSVAHAAQLEPERNTGRARWIGWSRHKIAAEMVAASSYPELPIWGELDSLGVMVEAALSGLGLVMLPTYVGDPEPRLRRLAKPDLRHVADFWLVTHSDLKDNARLRAAREHITALMTERAALFRGELTDPPAWSESGTLRREDAPSDAPPAD